MYPQNCELSEEIRLRMGIIEKSKESTAKKL